MTPDLQADCQNDLTLNGLTNIIVKLIIHMVGLVQLVRAPVCGTGSHGFESHIPPHLFLNPVTGVSPRGKARVFDSRIVGSNPATPANQN